MAPPVWQNTPSHRAVQRYDAVDLRDAPGTLAVIKPDSSEVTGAADEIAPVVDAHSMSPEVVLGTLAGLGGSVGEIFVVGCQPESLDEGMGLSAPVTAAVDGAVRLCHQLVADVLRPVRKEARA